VDGWIGAFRDGIVLVVHRGPALSKQNHYGVICGGDVEKLLRCA
jgi:hypothetical protein